MKIQNNKIDNYCKNFIENPAAILIYGADYGLINERISFIVNNFFNTENNNDPKLNIINIEASQLLNDPEFLEIEAKSLSLIASKKLIKIRSSNDKILEIISKYLLNPENTCIIVLIAESLSPRSKLRSYFEKHTSATSIPCYLDDKNTISDLIIQAFNKENIKADKNTINLLASYLGEDRLITVSEIEKAILLAGKEKTLENENVLSYIVDSNSINMDELYDVTLTGEIEKSFNILFRMQSQGISAIQIIRSFIKQLQNLIVLKKLIINNDVDSVLNNFKPPIFYKRKLKIKNQIQSLSEKNINKILNILNSSEIYCKKPKSSQNLIIKQAILTIGLITKQVK